MEAGKRLALHGGGGAYEHRVARRSVFEHDLVMAAISLVAGGRYPEVDVVNIDTTSAIGADTDALAVADGVAIVPIDADGERVHGLAFRRR